MKLSETDLTELYLDEVMPYYYELEEYWDEHGDEWIADTFGICFSTELRMDEYMEFSSLDALIQYSFKKWVISTNEIFAKKLEKIDEQYSNTRYDRKK